MSNLPSTSSTASTSTSSSIKTRHADESLRKIDIIGEVSHQIHGAKLPSIRQTLQVLFYNMRFVKTDLRNGARLAVDAVLIIWQQARIPTARVDYCVEKLLKIYESWRNILKTVPSKRSRTQKEVAEMFSSALDDLFDIATKDVLEEIRIDEDREFLIMQRQKGRPGCMAGVDMNLYAREMRSIERRNKEQSRKRKHEEMLTQHGTY